MEIKNRHFIVTGGASGLGAAVCELLVECGGKVTIADLNEELGTRYAKSLDGIIQF
ncbi:MAG: SDR family NAD(P)-dependent oxidoreductase, partial [Gammaproteobacteria bacterium]